MNDDFDTRLGTALRSHSPEPQTHLTLDDVAPVARRIRARRRAAVGAAALGVVLAAAVPIGLSTLGSPDAAPPPAQKGEKDGDRTQDNRREPTVLTLDGNVRLDPSASGEWITPENNPIGVDADWARAPGQVVRLGESHLVVSPDENAELTARFVTQGKVEWSSMVRGDAVHDRDESAAVLTAEGDLVVLSAAGERRTFAEGLSDTTRLGAVRADEECISTGLVNPCYVVISDELTPALPKVVNADGTTRDVTGAPKAVTARFGGGGSLVTVLDDFDTGTTPCSTVLDVYGNSTGEGDKKLWGSCTVSATDFSPNGTTAVVVDSDTDGIGPGRLGLADGETGDVHTWIEPDGRGFLGETHWVSESLLEVSSYSWDTRTWRIHAVNVDDQNVVAQMATPVEGEDMDFPFMPIER